MLPEFPPVTSETDLALQVYNRVRFDPRRNAFISTHKRNGKIVHSAAVNSNLKAGWPILAPESSAYSLAQKTRAAQAQRGGIGTPDRAEIVNIYITYLLSIRFLNKGSRGHAMPHFPLGRPLRQIPVCRAVSPWTKIHLPSRNSSRMGSILWRMVVTMP